MSSLIAQLREVLQGLSEEANKIRDPEIKRRYYFLKRICQSQKCVKRSCENLGKSRDYFYDLACRLIESRSLEGLRLRSRKPKL